MKNRIKTYLVVACTMMLTAMTSCDNDKFLTVDHYSILAADQMFKTDEDAKAGLVGAMT